MSNDTNTLERCPAGSDVGPLGRSTEFVDTFVAGFIYAAAIEGLIEQTSEIDRMLGEIEGDEVELLPALKDDLADIDSKWILATRMFSIEA
jgi:hypothetical protein|tara:strand:+ start:167 stop:439 length:273 start_codon:yes stop_codon:yes gene_type:complete